MKNMKNNTKKWLVIAGCLSVCVVLAVLIGSQFQKKPITDGPLPSQSTQPTDITVQPPQTETEKEVSVTPPDTTEPVNEDKAAASDGTEQTIQKDAAKPEYTEEQLTDSTQKPNGEKVTEPLKSVEHDKVEAPKDPPKTEKQPQSGGLPGFDNVPDGGANQVINADDMYENGNKIGNMD